MSDGPVISREALLKGQLAEETVEVSGLGVVRVRSLSRAEFMEIRELDKVEWEIKVVAYGMADPVLTPEDVQAWRAVTPHRVYDDLAGEILRVSGLRTVAVEEAKRTFPEE